MKRVVLSLSVAGAAGCGWNHGFIRDDTSSHEFRYDMQLAGQRFIKTVSGTATDGSVLCFIPIDSEPYRRAMDELYARAELEPNQEIVNLREDHGVRGYFFFYCTGSTTISGDVVEFIPAIQPAPTLPGAAQPSGPKG